MYESKEKALKAYAAYRAITHTESLSEYLQMVVGRIRKVAPKKEDTTTAKISKRVLAKILANKKKKKKEELPFLGTKIRSKGKGRGLGTGQGVGPIGRMK